MLHCKSSTSLTETVPPRLWLCLSFFFFLFVEPHHCLCGSHMILMPTGSPCTGHRLFSPPIPSVFDYRKKKLITLSNNFYHLRFSVTVSVSPTRLWAPRGQDCVFLLCLPKHLQQNLTQSRCCLQSDAPWTNSEIKRSLYFLIEPPETMRKETFTQVIFL